MPHDHTNPNRRKAMNTSITGTVKPQPPATRKRRRDSASAKESPTHGAKLLCIDDSNIRRNYSPGPPVRGRLYCAREIYTDGGRPGVLLVGIHGPLGHDGLEQGFFLSRFHVVRSS